MRVDPSNQRRQVNKTAQIAETQTRPASVKRDNMSLAGTEALDKAMQSTPAVRPEKVARAKALLADPAYPSAAVLNRVTDLLTQHLQD